jgi:hypothetical protein
VNGNSVKPVTGSPLLFRCKPKASEPKQLLDSKKSVVNVVNGDELFRYTSSLLPESFRILLPSYFLNVSRLGSRKFVTIHHIHHRVLRLLELFFNRGKEEYFGKTCNR